MKYDTSRIIVEFNDKNTKEEMLSAVKYKLKTNPITAKEIHSSFSDFKIYLKDQLTTAKKIILYWIMSEFLNKHNVFDINQFGFRNNACYDTIQFIYKNIGKK